MMQSCILYAAYILSREIDAPSLLHNDQVDLMHWLNWQKTMNLVVLFAGILQNFSQPLSFASTLEQSLCDKAITFNGVKPPSPIQT